MNAAATFLMSQTTETLLRMLAAARKMRGMEYRGPAEGALIDVLLGRLGQPELDNRLAFFSAGR